ncbi:MAG TPA: cytochrome c peroxidase, partial [Gemmataceae bacterium]
GGVGAGAGDPAALGVLVDGTVAVCLAGVNEVALLPPHGGPVRRITVGRRPIALVGGPAGQLIAVNTLDDSLSVIDLHRVAVARTIALGPRPPLTARDRGERHFYDARLSADGWMSCSSCHPDGHTTGLLCDTLGDGSYGTPKRTLTLMGTRLTDPWGWTGQFRYLHDQTEQSLRQTMHTADVTPGLIRELDTFQSSLPAPPPAEPVTDDPADRALVERGRSVFEAHGCGECHVPPLTYSSHGIHDVGLADERGVRRFSPPSLRGVGHGRRFLHDGRAGSLAEVFTKYRHRVGEGIKGDDLAALLRFLRSI